MPVKFLADGWLLSTMLNRSVSCMTHDTSNLQKTLAPLNPNRKRFFYFWKLNKI